MKAGHQQVTPDAILGASIVLGLLAAIISWIGLAWLSFSIGPLPLFERPPYKSTWSERLSSIACFVLPVLVFWVVARVVSRVGSKSLASTKLQTHPDKRD
jgi:hypothetical protein